MKLKVRTLSSKEIDVEVHADALISDVKRKVEEAMPHMSAAQQILIHQGRILNDSTKLTEYANIKEGDKLIVMPAKVRGGGGRNVCVFVCECGLVWLLRAWCERERE